MHYRLKLEIAYQFREGLRLNNWKAVNKSLKDYQEVRTTLCPAYMDGAKEIKGFANERDCVVFPLWCRGGGEYLCLVPNPNLY